MAEGGDSEVQVGGVLINDGPDQSLDSLEPVKGTDDVPISFLSDEGVTEGLDNDWDSKVEENADGVTPDSLDIKEPIPLRKAFRPLLTVLFIHPSKHMKEATFNFNLINLGYKTFEVCM